MESEKKFTFLEKIFCREKPTVAAKAAKSPTNANEISVTVAIATPPIIGTSDKYICNERFR